MRFVYVSVIVLMCFVEDIQSERTRSGACDGCESHEGYTRIKRAKYYSNPPSRFYKRPPMIYPVKGVFSYTPPPGYMMDDDERQPQNYKTKVSNRHTNAGLGDEDMNNIIKYLSKQNLDKIIEFANEKEAETPKYSKEPLFQRPNYITNKPEVKKFESNIIYKDSNLEADNGQKFSLSGPYIRPDEDFRPYKNDYDNSNENTFQETKPFIFSDQEPTALFINKNNFQFNKQQDFEGSKQSQHANSNLEMNGNLDTTGINIFTDSSAMQEEQLPKPSNLREDDYDVSYTNNVPTVVKADSESYKVENLGHLPLMNYHSKLDTIDSYKVPHYTVTSSGRYISSPPSASVNSLPVENAPPASSAQEQSDAHLKAIKIWTHRSTGIAYTLNDDGTLSLERPSRPKSNYG